MRNELPMRSRFDLIDQEQLAAQLVAVMDAHFQRPSPDEKRAILQLASDQIGAVVRPERAGDPEQGDVGSL